MQPLATQDLSNSTNSILESGWWSSRPKVAAQTLASSDHPFWLQIDPHLEVARLRSEELSLSSSSYRAFRLPDAVVVQDSRRVALDSLMLRSQEPPIVFFRL